MISALKKLILPLTRFGIVGLTATLIHAAVFIGAIEILSLPAVPSVVLAFSVALTLSHFGHHRWTFRSTTSHLKSFPRFAAVAGFGLTLNTVITWLVVDVFHLWYGIALGVIIVVVPPLTFIASSRTVYKVSLRA